jgi:hypothetical protein
MKKGEQDEKVEKNGTMQEDIWTARCINLGQK